jgi:hypothetical protein
MATGRSVTGQVQSRPGALGTTPENSKPIIRYVNKIASDGWVQTLKANGTDRLPLCKYTKVQILETKNGRTFFKVLDGTHAKNTVSMQEANAKEYLGIIAPKQTPLKLTVKYGKFEEKWISKARGGEELKQQWATLTTEDGLSITVTMNSVWNGVFYPLPPGSYTVLLPDVPHNKNMTRFYRDSEPKLIHDQVWFPIAFGDNSRYVHVGNLSDGCVTVVDLAKWADLQEALISHRSADGKSVALLTVTGKPEREK